ncbi:MAG: DUF4180 domain-containing protein [Spirochaetaceae bacterium]|nr:DUF4180 domain-containing protein [Spirochaetaceae bacterium]
MVILGDFSNIESMVLRQFIGESNRGGRVVFAEDLENGLAALRQLRIARFPLPVAWGRGCP